MFLKRFSKSGPIKRGLSSAGAALIEMAIILPVLLTLLTAEIYISGMLGAHALVANLAQEGARIMSREPARQHEVSELANFDRPNPNLPFAPVRTYLNHVAVPVSAPSRVHNQIYELLAAMNERDGRFRLSNIILTTSYDPGTNFDDSVTVSITANAEVVSIFSAGILAMTGLSNRITSTASQPYLLTVR